MIHTLFSKYPSGFLVTKEKGAPTAKVVVTTPSTASNQGTSPAKKERASASTVAGFEYS